MAQGKTFNAGAASKRARPPLYINVLQRPSKGVGPGPIHVVKKVPQEIRVGSAVQKVRMPVYLAHTLPAGTATLTASDRKAFADEGLTAAEIAYVESKLPEKKLRSDAHKAAFEADRAPRLRAKLKQRLLDQITADPQLAAEVLATLRKVAPEEDDARKAPVLPQRPPTLSEKVCRMLALLAEVSHDIEVYKERAKMGKMYDQAKLRSMLSADAARDWKLTWFAFSQMIDQATGTPFARPRGWASNPELSKVAAAHGYKSEA